MNIKTRLLHVYAHLMFRAILDGADEDMARVGAKTFYRNYMAW